MKVKRLTIESLNVASDKEDRRSDADLQQLSQSCIANHLLKSKTLKADEHLTVSLSIWTGSCAVF